MSFSRFIAGFLLVASVGCGSHPVATGSTPSPTVSASPSLSAGQQNLHEAQQAFAQKKFVDAAIHADLAAELLKGESAPVKQRIEAHRLAGQAYYKRKEFDKALSHYQALLKLEPKNKGYASIARELAARQPGAAAADDRYLKKHLQRMRSESEARSEAPPTMGTEQAYPTAAPRETPTPSATPKGW